MEVINYPEKKTWIELTKRPLTNDPSVDMVVKEVLFAVKNHGDEAVKNYTYQFDKVRIDSLIVTKEEIAEAIYSIDSKLKHSIDIAKKNIAKFHAAQKHEVESLETSLNVRCWQKCVPIQKIGLYIPGGTAPLFSTVLMLGVPAIVAGCDEIILCSPPDKDGKIPPVILFTAHLLGIKKIFKAGGAQAIAAMAYGTKSIPKVFKIFGPGNRYVTAAKQLVNREGIAIDMPAGPSEVAIIADETCIPEFVAADMLSQAEHGPDSQVILLTTNEAIVPEIEKELELQLKQLPRKDFASRSLGHSKAIVMHSMEDLLELCNEYAPEHLIISAKNYNEIADQIINAGSVFLGNYSPESAGDYISGTNHTLPTNGYAKAYSGLNYDSFVKKITFQEIDKAGLLEIGQAIEEMATAEQLLAHKNAVTVRLRK
jgi:histidinol dehydrogenase